MHVLPRASRWTCMCFLGPQIPLKSYLWRDIVWSIFVVIFRPYFEVYLWGHIVCHMCCHSLKHSFVSLDLPVLPRAANLRMVGQPLTYHKKKTRFSAYFASPHSYYGHSTKIHVYFKVTFCQILNFKRAFWGENEQRFRNSRPSIWNFTNWKHENWPLHPELVAPALGLPASRRGRDKQGFRSRARNPPHLLPYVASSAHTLPHFATVLPQTLPPATGVSSPPREV